MVQAALQDGTGAVVEGRHVAAAADLDAVCSPELLEQFLRPLSAARCVMFSISAFNLVHMK